MTLAEIIAAHHAARPTSIATPKGTAIRLVYLLRRELEDCDAADRHAVLNLLKEEILALPVTA